MALTTVALNALKPRDKAYKLADERGLNIQVMPNGSKLWRYKYRLHGVEKWLSIGGFPAISLAEARKRRAEARAFIDAGRDPAIERRQAKLVAALSAETTFNAVAREFIEQKMAGDGALRTPSIRACGFLSS